MGAPLRWFPFDVDAWDTDETVRRMSMAERGVLITLLAWQWREGSVPGDAKSVAKALGCSCPLVAKVLDASFIDDGSGDERLVNRKLCNVLAEQVAKSDKAATAGRASAAARAGKSLNRSRIRTKAKQSLEAAPEPNSNGNGVHAIPAPKPSAKKLPSESEQRRAFQRLRAPA